MNARPVAAGWYGTGPSSATLPAGETVEPDEILHGLVTEWAPAGRLARSPPVGVPRALVQGEAWDDGSLKCQNPGGWGPPGARAWPRLG